MNLISELTPHDAHSCDWGDCNNDPTATRWDPDLSMWLPVCDNHTLHA